MNIFINRVIEIYKEIRNTHKYSLMQIYICKMNLMKFKRELK